MISCRVLSLMDRFPKPCVAGSNPAGATFDLRCGLSLFTNIDSTRVYKFRENGFINGIAHFRIREPIRRFPVEGTR